ncbi:NADP-dependent oxidoreductase [Lacticaseibacillus suibinensis]|uniref:NADP-dependent oxidoreductase n=1 Tax=Lacticaseibacillus suibinensis TaxID=2486011 RepID=UPI000F795D54|nr:NADP-dependent oxidoreductase [Lacticaseibacillus suibinensis]
MIRFGFNQYGAPQVFQALESDPPQPKPGQVQLKVLGFGLNPYDASLRRGEQAPFRKLSFPIVPGTDVLGSVTQLGEGVTEFAVGDVVINYRPIGGYSEYVTASVGKVIKKPALLGDAAAAGLGQVGIAAYSILQQLNLASGQTLAVLGASGGVGALVVQMAKHEGLRVLAIAGSASQPYLESLGADQVATYDAAPNLAAADATVNAINGGDDHGLGSVITKVGGTLLTTAYRTPDLQGKNLKLIQLGDDRPAKAEVVLPYLAELATTTSLSIQITERLPFSVAGVVQGHELLETHHAPGKLVVLR